MDKLRKSDGLTLNELCETLPMTRQAVSKHLRILKEANLIGTVRRGREKLHYLNAAPIQEIYSRWVRKYETHFIDELNNLKKELESYKGKKEK